MRHLIRKLKKWNNQGNYSGYIESREIINKALKQIEDEIIDKIIEEGRPYDEDYIIKMLTRWLIDGIYARDYLGHVPGKDIIEELKKQLL